MNSVKLQDIKSSKEIVAPLYTNSETSEKEIGKITSFTIA